jgi:hypothetical protein
VIRVLVCDRPALPLGKRAADSELIGDRRIALIVGRVPRVDADLHDFTSVENFRLAAHLGFEQLASGLPREHSHERANCVITPRVDRRRRKAASRSRKTSSSLASFASSFGHDTPAPVERRFVIRGVRDGDEWAAPECGSERVEIGVERGRCVRRSDRVVKVTAIESICLNQDAVGTRLSSVIPKRSTSDDVEGVPCGTCEMFRKYASLRVLTVNGDPNLDHRVFADFKRSAGGVNARRPCGTHGRSGAESVDAAEHRMKIHNAMGERSQSTRGEI